MARMMRSVTVALLSSVLGAASCGGVSGPALNEDERALQGSWYFEVSTAEAVGVSFRDLDYELDDVAILNDGSTAMEVEVGTFSTTGNAITFVPKQWSCRGSDPPYTGNFTVTGASFTLANPTTVIAFQKLTPTGGQRRGPDRLLRV